MYNYNCPDCEETKIQSDKNTRKINEVIDQVNELTSLYKDTENFIQEKANEKVQEVANVKVPEMVNNVIGEVNAEIDNINSSLEDIAVNVIGEVNTEIDNINSSLDDIAVNVKNFGAKGDGTTDDTEAIQNAFNSPGKSIFFPIGHYKINRPINITKKRFIKGKTTIGEGHSKIELSSLNEKDYIFYSESSAYCTHNIEGLEFIGVNGIDLRSATKDVIKTFSIKECIFKGSDSLGIAIHSINTDFSLIERCYFGGKFYACIRVSGFLDNDVTNLKASTQVKIKDNIFIDYNNDLIGTGISLECVDSCEIVGNDFSFSRPNCIDIGGSYYFNNLPRSQNMYLPNVNNRSKYIGWCSNVNIRDNHIEAYNEGIILDGNELDYMFSNRITGNNFQSPKENSKAIICRKGVFATYIGNNLIDLKETTQSYGILLEQSRNCFVDMNDISGKSNNFIVDNNGLNNTIFRKTKEGTLRNEISWGYPKFHLAEIKADSLITDKESFKFGGVLTTIPTCCSVTEKIEVNEATLDVGERVSIYTFPCTQRIGDVKLMVYTSVGQERIYSTINNNEITKTIGETSTFNLSIEDNQIYLTNSFSQSITYYAVVGKVDYVGFSNI